MCWYKFFSSFPSLYLATKPGVCPHYTTLPAIDLRCMETCQSDDSCQGDQKCCSNGCGYHCMGPVGHNSKSLAWCKVELIFFLNQIEFFWFSMLVLNEWFVLKVWQPGEKEMVSWIVLFLFLLFAFYYSSEWHSCVKQCKFWFSQWIFLF